MNIYIYIFFINILKIIIFFYINILIINLKQNTYILKKKKKRKL